MITLSWLLLIALAGGIVALVDAILRLRGRGLALGIIELIVAVLFLVSLFISGIPLGSVVLAGILVIVMLIGMFIRGRGGFALPLVGVLLLVFWFLLANEWLIIPGIN